MNECDAAEVRSLQLRIDERSNMHACVCVCVIIVLRIMCACVCVCMCVCVCVCVCVYVVCVCVMSKKRLVYIIVGDRGVAIFGKECIQWISGGRRVRTLEVVEEVLRHAAPIHAFIRHRVHVIRDIEVIHEIGFLRFALSGLPFFPFSFPFHAGSSISGWPDNVFQVVLLCGELSFTSC